MPTTDALRKALADARKAKHSADVAIKRLVDTKVPHNAKKAKGNLLDRLRSILRRMAERIPALRKRLQAKRRDGGKKAARWANDQTGVTESPPSSNRGPFPITACQVFTIGYDGVAWCGCFVAYAAIKIAGARIPSKARLAYTPYIVSDAKAQTNGLRAVPVSEAQDGDLIVFDFDGGGADHVGLCVGPTVNGMTDCVEGNTSSDSTGSQSNGGGVFERHRPISQVAVCARPDYR